MKYADGRELRVGDRVKVGAVDGGVVVASIDTGQFTDAQARTQWRFLKKGAVVMLPAAGLVYRKDLGSDIRLMQRAG
ncbi:MAG: hypothetical protein ABI616_12535 [Pseudomonadota bacterium]